MPGGGAEIFSPRLAKLLKYTGKADPERWCEIHGIAHGLGISTNATMLYGHVETHAERVDHLLRLREQQDASGGFVTFIPLTYQKGATQLVPRRPATAGAPSPPPGCSSTTSRTSRPTGSCWARRRRRSRSTSGPTTSTARWRTSGSSTSRARRRRPASPASSSSA